MIFLMQEVKQLLIGNLRDVSNTEKNICRDHHIFNYILFLWGEILLLHQARKIKYCIQCFRDHANCLHIFIPEIYRLNLKNFNSNLNTG